MDLFNRLQGIFFNPKVTLKAISEKPIWIDALIILLIAFAFFSYITAPYLQSSDKLQESWTL
ncbi:MAG: hypothetical protein E3J44_08115 [Candidatus Aminicenantes bacterium]|nr:MAG: hypothetical protein E3J44_08115 [Candidatus Aminicenantes bacterium]